MWACNKPREPYMGTFCSGSWVADRCVLLLSCFWCLYTQILPNLYLLLERSFGLIGPGPAIPWFWRPDQNQRHRQLRFQAMFMCADIFSSIIGVFLKKESGNRLINIGPVAVLGSRTWWQLIETFSKTQTCITEYLGCPPGAKRWQTSHSQSGDPSLKPQCYPYLIFPSFL